MRETRQETETKTKTHDLVGPAEHDPTKTDPRAHIIRCTCGKAYRGVGEGAWLKMVRHWRKEATR